MLSKAEANLAAVDRLSEEVIAQKDELHRMANQELECVKNRVRWYFEIQLSISRPAAMML